MPPNREFPIIVVILVATTFIAYGFLLPRPIPVTTYNPFPNLPLEAHAAIVFDPLTNKIIFDKEATSSAPLASLTKLMTSLVASNNLATNSIITISQAAAATEGDDGLKVGEEWRRDDLIDLTLVTSSNDGAVALAEATEAATGKNFVTLMNEEAATLGLNQTSFQNPTGLDQNGPGAYGSARDVARLINYLATSKPRILAATSQNRLIRTSLEGGHHLVINTDPLTASLAGLRASKTGLTDLAGGNLALIVDLGLRQPVIIVVLGSSQGGRFRDAALLADAASQALNQTK